MISTSNYVARKYGVRSAMPGFIAKRLCPQLVFVDCHYEKYEKASLIAQEVVKEYNPKYIHDFGLDEFYVDITEFVNDQYMQQYPSACSMPPDAANLRVCAERVVSEIRKRICDRTGGLTCSAGIAHNFFLAKIGADKNKPNGQFSIHPTRDSVVDFIRDLPCRKVGGIGKVTEKILVDLGVNMMGEIKDRLPVLYNVLPSKLCYFLTRTCLGIGSEEGNDAMFNNSTENTEDADNIEVQKRMSCERTFTTTSDKKAMYCKLYDICMSLAPKIRSKGLKPQTVTLKLKTSSFDIINRSISKEPSGTFFDDGDEIFEATKAILDKLLPLKLRLIGVSASKFSVTPCSRDKASIDSYFGKRSFIKSGFNCENLCCQDRGERGEHLSCPAKSPHSDNIDDDWSMGIIFTSTTDKMLISADATEEYKCPVCDCKLQLTLQCFNYHVDECLTRTALISEVSQSLEPCSPELCNKSGKIDLFLTSAQSSRICASDLTK